MYLNISLFVLLCALVCTVNAENLRGTTVNVVESVAEDIAEETLLSHISRRLQAKYNRFRSYANAKVKPPMYSRTSRRHDVSEYLSPVQKYMVSHQKRDTPDVMFKSGWSGFDKNQ